MYVQSWEEDARAAPGCSAEKKKCCFLTKQYLISTQCYVAWKQCVNWPFKSSNAVAIFWHGNLTLILRKTYSVSRGVTMDRMTTLDTVSIHPV